MRLDMKRLRPRVPRLVKDRTALHRLGILQKGQNESKKMAANELRAFSIALSRFFSVASVAASCRCK